MTVTVGDVCDTAKAEKIWRKEMEKIAEKCILLGGECILLVQ